MLKSQYGDLCLTTEGCSNEELVWTDPEMTDDTQCPEFKLENGVLMMRRSCNKRWTNVCPQRKGFNNIIVVSSTCSVGDSKFIRKGGW